MEKNISYCPDCGGEIRFKRTPFMGQKMTCRQCNTALVVVGRSPIELDWVDFDEIDFEEYDDWEEVSHPSNQNSRFHHN